MLCKSGGVMSSDFFINFGDIYINSVKIVDFYYILFYNKDIQVISVQRFLYTEIK